MKGKRVGIITSSGGSGSMMAKSSELYGLEVPEFSKRLKDDLSELIPFTASASNPIDVTFDTNFLNIFYKFPKMLMKSGEVDVIIVWGLFDFDDIIETIEKSGMTVRCVWRSQFRRRRLSRGLYERRDDRWATLSSSYTSSEGQNYLLR